MTRRLLIALCLLAVPLAAAPDRRRGQAKASRAGSSERSSTGPIKERRPHPRRPGVRPHGLVRRRVRSHQLLLGARCSPLAGTTTSRRPTRSCARAATHGQSAAARGDGGSALGSQVPGQGGLPAQAGGRLHRLPYRARRALRTEGHVLDREPDVPKRPIREWQIWNEPNLPYQWARAGGQGSSRSRPAYGKLLRASRSTLRKARPGVEGRAGRAHQQLLDGPRRRCTSAAASRAISTSRP